MVSVRLCEAALSLIVVSLFTSSAFGQPSSAGVIRGTVIDAASGTPLRKVSVWLQSTGQTVLIDDQGRFEMIEVTAGPQELCVSVADFGLSSLYGPSLPENTQSVLK